MTLHGTLFLYENPGAYKGGACRRGLPARAQRVGISYGTKSLCGFFAGITTRMQKLGAVEGDGGSLQISMLAALVRRPTTLRRYFLRTAAWEVAYEGLRQRGLCWVDKFGTTRRQRDGARSRRPKMQRCCKLAPPVGSMVTRAPRARVAASHQRPGDEGKINETNRDEIPELWSCTLSSTRLPVRPQLRET